MTESALSVNHLRSFIERVERLELEKAAAADAQALVYNEMKGMGFDTKAVRKIIALRKMDEAARQEAEAMIDLYKEVLGMS